MTAGSLVSNRNVAELLWSRYRTSLRRQPLLTKSITTVVGSALGDAIAQGIQPGRHKYDVARTVRLAAIGGLLVGPMAHGWFKVLDKTIMPNNSKHPVAVVTKTVLDQVIMAPLGSVAFYMALATMHGAPTRGIAEVKQKLVPTLMSSYRLWPAAHLVNFALVAPNMRVLYMNIVSVIWAAMLSTIASRPGPRNSL